MIVTRPRHSKVRQATLILDGQWGSTGKGLLAGYLALTNQPTAAVCNFGPNAGHTCLYNYAGGEHTIMTTQLPTAIISPSVRHIFIGPGAVINVENLNIEVAKYALFNQSIYIHERAAIITEECREQERKQLSRISSTLKGVGAAMCRKIMRYDGAVMKGYATSMHPQCRIVSHDEYTTLLNSHYHIQIESAQGYELGISQGSDYPHCTSRDITPYQILADCGCTADEITVGVTMRTYPIRVGHQFDAAGNKIGDSGPVYSDQRELTWEEMELPEEKTTVTGKIRRIFTFSMHNLSRMLINVQPDFMFLNFCNYTPDEGNSLRNMVNALAHDYGWYHNIVHYTGHGPHVRNIKEHIA